MKHKLIVIEGTDCSGKQTQSELLNKKLQAMGYGVQKSMFPMYNTPTGRLIAGPYLGKAEYGTSFFPEGASHVDGKVAGLYFAADRYYNKQKLLDILNANHLILDRYVESNMAHQAGKEKDPKKRAEIYKWFAKLEYEMLELPKPDIRVFLYMPNQFAGQLKKDRKEKPDGHESDEDYLKLAETAYLELAKKLNYKVVNCVKDGKVRTIEDINQELTEYVVSKLEPHPTKQDFGHSK